MEAFVRRGGASSAGATSVKSTNISTPDTDFYRDRRKKDIHNMSKSYCFMFLFFYIFKLNDVEDIILTIE